MINVGAIAGVTNVSPLSGDRAGSVAATILGQNSNNTYNASTIGLLRQITRIALKVAVLPPLIQQAIRDCGRSTGNYRLYVTGGGGFCTRIR